MQTIHKYLKKRLTSVRQPIELHYGGFFNRSRLYQNKEAFKLFLNAEESYRIGIVGFFLQNCHTCMNGCVVNSFFNTRAPTLEEYLPLDEELREYTPHQAFSNYDYGM